MRKAHSGSRILSEASCCSPDDASDETVHAVLTSKRQQHCTRRVALQRRRAAR